VREDLKEKIGIYIAYPTTSELKPIFKGLKTKVNNNHTKVGKCENGFLGREKDYHKTFNNEVEFHPIVILNTNEDVKETEELLLRILKEKYKKVGFAQEWFDTNDHESVIKIIVDVVKKSSVDYELV
jgi:hypothetical protein